MCKKGYSRLALEDMSWQSRDHCVRFAMNKSGARIEKHSESWQSGNAVGLNPTAWVTSPAEVRFLHSPPRNGNLVQV